jgi:hypothetical protein
MTPYSQNSNPMRSDPIEAELHPDTLSSTPVSANGSASKCPIRFLDNHSPEEVAQYFENHKHEIPRSHEMCVKRHQSNAENIRQLDAKYGNLVSMIQGLGVMHQPLLPLEEDANEAVERPDDRSDERVQNWAKAVSAVDGDPDSSPGNEANIERQSHFDRPLKEIRVGESPSRPWGISIPIPDEPIFSSPPTNIPSGADGSPTPRMKEDMPSPKTASKPERFPFDPSKAPPLTPLPPDALHSRGDRGEQKSQMAPKLGFQQNPTFIEPETTQQSGTGGKMTPQMVFTGPVFIGYQVEDAIRIMQQLQPQP